MSLHLTILVFWPRLLQCWDHKHEPPYPGHTAFFTDEIVALKRLKMEKEKEGFPITSLREINTILKAQHPNIVTVRVRLSLHIWQALSVWEVYPLKGQGRRFRGIVGSGVSSSNDTHFSRSLILVDQESVFAMVGVEVETTPRTHRSTVNS